MDPLQPYQLPDPQGWAVAQERQRHNEALYRFGEYAAFIIMWTIFDFDKGLVERCPLCYGAFGKVAETYKQPAVNKCANCYGTTFNGGYKAVVVRPSMWDYTETDTLDHARGQIERANASVQTTSDFSMNSGDYIVRADESRWRVSGVSTNHLRTGFQHSNGHRDAVGFNYAQVVKEDATSVVFQMPPAPGVLQLETDVPGQRYPGDFSFLEDVRGPLL